MAKQALTQTVDLHFQAFFCRDVNILKRWQLSIFDSLHEIFDFGELFDFGNGICLNQATLPIPATRSTRFPGAAAREAGADAGEGKGLLRKTLGETPNLCLNAVEKLA
ncbi:MAG: hypothetical protein RIT26_1587 [Pseudomonadota bacterium]